MGEPTNEEELAILNRYNNDTPLEELQPVASCQDILDATEDLKNVFVHPVLLDYMVDICQATRNADRIASGVSPRGSLALLHAAKAYAYINGRMYVVPEDVKAIAVPVLAHRLVLDRAVGMKNAGSDLINGILEKITVPTEEWSR